jgi:hypothetical protein
LNLGAINPIGCAYNRLELLQLREMIPQKLAFYGAILALLLAPHASNPTLHDWTVFQKNA